MSNDQKKSLFLGKTVEKVVLLRSGTLGLAGHHNCHDSLELHFTDGTAVEVRADETPGEHYTHSILEIKGV